MGIFGHKENIPQIPSTPTLPNLPRREDTKPAELPSIPGNMTNDNFNQEMIKSAINNPTDQMDDSEEPKEEIDHIRNSLPELPSSQKIQIAGTTPLKKTIFVKIDKFNKAQESLRDIEEGIREMSSEVKALKEIKVKELKELDLWDEELKKVNARLSRIDSNIFGEK